MPHAMVSVDNKPYWFSEFEGDATSEDWFTDRSVMPPGTSPDKRQWKCTFKGDFIDVYALMKEAYGKPDNEFDYVRNDSGNYTFGKVIATHEFTSNGNVFIAGLVVSCYLGGTLPSYTDRQAEISTGMFSTAKTYDINIKYYYKAGANYNRYDFGDSTHRTGWYFQQNLSPATQSKQLAGLLGWQDGTASGLINQATLLLPVILSVGGEPIYIGLVTRIYLNSNLQFYGSFSDINISEDQDDFTAYNINFALYTETHFTTNPPFCMYDFTSGYTPPDPPEPPEDYPFENDTNEGGGGTGDYRDTSDTIPIDGTPTNSAIASGFVNAYLLTQQQVNDFHSYLYSTDFLTNVKKLMNDPIDYILAFMLAPYTPDTSANTNIMIGGTNSEVNALRISNGYKTVDCGTITLKEFWGKFYDYNPYTKVQIYLPFIGMRPLDIDDVMAGEINLKYRIDVLTGACVATISVNNTRGTNGAIYNFNGNCHSHIPVSGKNYLETVTNVLSAGVGALNGIAGSSTPELATVAGAINVFRSAKVLVEHSGELTGATGLLSNFTPFLMVSRPSQSLAQNYNHYRGFISNVTAQLGNLSGYTEVAELVQTNIHCTLDEFEEINDLLKSGVYL